METIPVLTSVNVVCKASSIPVADLTDVLKIIEAFVDAAQIMTLARAATFDSMDLLQRVAARQAERWSCLLSSLLIKSYRQEQFVEAMPVMVKRGFLPAAKWLKEVYFPDGKCFNLAMLAVQNSHADMLRWILDTFEDPISKDIISEALQRGNLNMIKVIWEKNLHQLLCPRQRNLCLKSSDLPLIQFLHVEFSDFDSLRAMRNAVIDGNLDTMLWLHMHYAKDFTPDMFYTAVSHGHLHVAQYLHSNHSKIAVITNSILNRAASHGHVKLLDWLHAHRTELYEPRWSGQHWNKPIARKTTTPTTHYWEVCKWLYENRYACIPMFFRIAAERGHLGMLEWLFDKYPHVVIENLNMKMDLVVGEKVPLNVVVWLHEKGFQFSLTLLCYPIKSPTGLTILQWFHANLPDLIMDQTVCNAAEAGQLDVVKFLYEQRPKLFSASTILKAVRNDQLDVLKFLHKHQSRGWSTKIMDMAASHGHLPIVQFLHKHRMEGCSAAAMNETTDIGILQFLHQKRSEICTSQAFDNAAAWGQLKKLEWLYENKRELVDLERIRTIAVHAHQHHIEHWIDAVINNSVAGFTNMQKMSR